MDQEMSHELPAGQAPDAPPAQSPRRTTRRQWLKRGAIGLGCAAAGGGAACWIGSLAWSTVQRISSAAVTSDVFRGDAPQGELWELWKKRGWVKEARHYLKLNGNTLCKLCPNECVLEPEDRSHCRNKVNKGGTLYTMAYGDPCAFNIDPIEKKPLFHFLPGARALSLATSGCVFRCLNCQNWDISQRKPEETKDPRGEPVRLGLDTLRVLAQEGIERMSFFPDDVVALAEAIQAPTIAYTYSEPIAYYEYMIDTCRLARQKNLKNLWITCGSIQEEPLVELCRVMDAANVNLKSYDEGVYRKLNAGKLEPILNTLKTLKREGVWFEVTNLIVPTYTDDLAMVGRMCDWLVENLGPDYPLHFSRFHPEHKLTHLPLTPVAVLLEAREVARKRGLRYVYIGNVPELEGAETTYCPDCHAVLVQRDGFAVTTMEVVDGKCHSCGAKIAGVWS